MTCGTPEKAFYRRSALMTQAQFRQEIAAALPDHSGLYDEPGR